MFFVTTRCVINYRGVFKASTPLIPDLLATSRPIQVRFKWADWRMARDVNKRIVLAQHAENKLRINAMRKNDILPREIIEIADQQINELPKNAVGIKIRSRCAITSRGNGNVLKWRVSRIVFRDLADHNLLSGVQRAMW